MPVSRFSNGLFSPLAITTIASFTVGLSSPALAINGFLSPFAPGDFTLTNTPGTGDGSINTTNATTGEVILTGSNNAPTDGPFNPVTTTWVLRNPVTQAFTITFDWSFAGEATPYNEVLGVGDRAGYLINGLLTELANADGQFSGPVTVNLLAGQTFGFVVDTADNTGSPGEFTVTNFNATPVPLESDALPIVFSAGFLGGGVWIKRRLKDAKK